MNRWPRQIFSS